ncbi:MAG: hypothetical protein Q9201_003605 [Fulgogasparrea decipioides]
MPGKRKQTPDMPTSPPKRVTRARAKKDGDPITETRVTTASARVSAKKSAAQRVKTEEPKIELDEEMTDEPARDAAIEQPVAEAPKTRGKAKATRSTSFVDRAGTGTLSSTVPAKSTRSRSTKTTAMADNEAKLPMPKGRAKNTAELGAPIVPETTAEDAEPASRAKASRGRAANAVATKPATTRAKAAAAAPKKRVKFDDHPGQDKENEPIRVNAKGKPEPKATGLRARPIRKPATSKAGARKTKTTKQGAKGEEKDPEQHILPLSPKKVTQVAKTPSVGSEDELAREKTPLRPLSMSPSKIPSSVNRDRDVTLPRLEDDITNAPQSSRKDTSPAGLAVSPRKPPPSPYKDALKQSPRKADLSSRVVQPKLDASSSPPKSPLKESPKRVNLGDPSIKPVLQWSKTPMKASLLQSLARRPGASAMKACTMFSNSKATAPVPTMNAATASKQVSAFKLPALTTESAASSPLRAAKSPSQHFKVHDLTKEPTSDFQTGMRSSSPAKELETDMLDGAAMLRALDTKLEPEEELHPADENTMSKSTPAEVEQEPSPSSINEDSKLYQRIGEDQEIVAEPQAIDMQQGQGAVNDIDNVPTPMPRPPIFAGPGFILASPTIASKVDDSESEDELASPQKSAASSPLKNCGIWTKDFGTSSVITTQEGTTPSAQSHGASTRAAKRDSIAFTPLATQMSSWLASSPEKRLDAQGGQRRGIFSPALPVFSKRNEMSPGATVVGSSIKVSFFDDEMAIRGSDDAAMVLEEGSTDELQDTPCHGPVDVHSSFDSQASDEYGDENAVPEQPTAFLVQQREQDQTLTCTPAKVFVQQDREIHTVSKVPLRPAADDTPLAVPRKRSRSLIGPLADIGLPDRLSISRDSVLSPILKDVNLSMSMLLGEMHAADTPEMPTGGTKSALNTPGRSIRKAGYSNVLKGAVVHVDVHTTEGADASGIFVDLLTQMGARCVKQWHWNPQATPTKDFATSPQEVASPETGTLAGKIGITHVVYKDGGKRTLEKVREAKGAVLCVGVGWVLDCEREDKWLNEADYAVDPSIIPRGGSRRRKSMEPRVLANFNGNLVPAETPLKAPVVEVSPTKEFLTFDTPVCRRETFEIPNRTPVGPDEEACYDSAGEGFDSPLSPTTPYYLSKGARLVQQTCPPKQSQELFFPLSGKIEDQPNELMRQRLLMARRKSLQWTSKVQSPLGRTVSYGK